MRRLLVAVPFLFACGGSEMPPADEPATAMAMLTEADVAGTWQGTAVLAGTDSVISHWTQVCGGGNCTGTTQEAPDTTLSTYVIEGDSVVGSTPAFANPTMGGTMVTDHWVVRVTGNTATGSGMFRLADQPDSVVARYTFTGNRVP